MKLVTLPVVHDEHDQPWLLLYVKQLTTASSWQAARYNILPFSSQLQPPTWPAMTPIQATASTGEGSYTEGQWDQQSRAGSQAVLWFPVGSQTRNMSAKPQKIQDLHLRSKIWRLKFWKVTLKLEQIQTEITGFLAFCFWFSNRNRFLNFSVWNLFLFPVWNRFFLFLFHPLISTKSISQNLGLNF